MIKRIIISEKGLKSAAEECQVYANEYKENVLYIPVQRYVKDFSGKTYRIAAICKGGLDHNQIERIKLFLESFAIDYQHKLLDLNFCAFEDMNLEKF
jgi:hypothetical protein